MDQPLLSLCGLPILTAIFLSSASLLSIGACVPADAPASSDLPASGADAAAAADAAASADAGGGDAQQPEAGKPADAAAPAASTWKQVSAAHDGEFTCAVTTGGAAYCWGAGSFGQLGDGKGDWTAPLPVPVSGLQSGVASISAGTDHACAVTTAGAAWCWGTNGWGQLGNGGLAHSLVPVPVTGLGSGVTAISAGREHTCAITTLGVLCWGTPIPPPPNGGPALPARPHPVPITGFGADVTSITAGDWYDCAITTKGSAYCWGDNYTGTLGNGSFESATDPVPVMNLASGVTAISAGHRATCAIAGGAAYCWGSNFQGELGIGTSGGAAVPSRVSVSGLGSGVTSINAGYNYACAVMAAGAWCWGLNDNGQLGNGTGGGGQQSTTPVAVTGMGSFIVAISAGAYHTCALTTDGAVSCWGANNRGQLGALGHPDGSHTAVQVRVP